MEPAGAEFGANAAGAPFVVGWLATASGLLANFMPATDLPINLVARADSGVFLFGLAISAFATLLFGLLPALRAGRVDVVDDLRDGARGATRGASHDRLRRAPDGGLPTVERMRWHDESRSRQGSAGRVTAPSSERPW